MSAHGLKSIAAVTEPDIRQAAFVKICRESGEFVPITIADLHGEIEQISLTGAPPPKVLEQFDLARNLLLYSWFEYEFSTPAKLQCFGALELALRDKLKTLDEPIKGRPSLKHLLRMAIDRKWITDGAFPFLFENGDASDVLGTRPTKFERDGTSYCQTVLNAVPTIRNHIAHGHRLVGPTGSALRSFEICACIIDRLFPAAKPEAEHE